MKIRQKCLIFLLLNDITYNSSFKIVLAKMYSIIHACVHIFFFCVHILYDAVKVVLKGKFITLKSYIRKEEKSKTSNLSFHFVKVEKRRAN